MKRSSCTRPESQPQRSGAGAAAACCSTPSTGSAGSTAGSAAACLVTLTLLMLAEDHGAGAVELHPVGAGRHPGRLGVFLLPDGGVLHLRRRHDAARRRPYPRHAGARRVLAARPRRAARDRAGGRWPRLFIGFLAWSMATFAWRAFDARPDLDVERHAAVDSAGRRRLRHGAADAAVRGALHPGAARPAARGSSHARPRRSNRPRGQPISFVSSMFAVLFVCARPGGIWIGLTLARHRHAAARAVPQHPARQAARAIRLEHPHHAGAAGAAAVHPDGRDPVPHALSRSLFQGLAPWAGLLPGRLLHVNVVGCSIFAAISGSSAATTQVVGRIALAELLQARLFARTSRSARSPAPARSAS